MHVAIGPITPRASWKWLGPHLAESLADTCTVHFFRDGALPLCDVVIFIKERPEIPLQQARANACQIIYMPVDVYRSQAQLEADAPFLRSCAGLLVHSRRLGAALARHNSTIGYVDHPNLHGLARKPPYRASGRLLWIGDFLNLPYLLRWRERVELPYELDVLTNARRMSIGGMAMTLDLAHRLGVELDVSADYINGIPMHEWDVETEQRMMTNAKAALDIKGGEEDFFQFTKPPTKGQQFIVSGIPFAANASNSICQDLLEQGFEVADVGDHDRWFSHDYWQRTQAFSTVLEERIRPGVVALAYQRFLQEVLGRVSPVRTRSLEEVTSRPPAAENQKVLARWQGYVQAWSVLRRLGASWKDAAPYRVKRVVELFRTYVPGYVSCTISDSTPRHETILVSMIVDAPAKADADDIISFPKGIPDRWEIIAFVSRVGKVRSGLRFKSLTRWPRRGALRDRMLAAGHAEGDYLAFVPGCDAGAIAWTAEALATLQAAPETAMVRRNPDAASDADHAATFMVRRDVWRALRGYHRGQIMTSARCGDLDLSQRIRLLGYAIEPAPGRTPQPNRQPGSQIGADTQLVVYTAITNQYDRLVPLDPGRVKPARQVAFLDEATRSAATSTGNWEIRALEEREQDPNRQAKLHKIRPELFFPDANYSLWIDGNVSLIYPFDIQRLIELFLADTDLCIGRHYARSCIYQESEACKQRGLDSAELIDQQVARYRQEGFPPWYGLNQAVVILRRHTETVRAFNELWWQEICRGSRRDQLSFNYVQWKTGLPIGEFPLPIQDNNGLFTKVSHTQRRPLRYAAGPMLRTAIHRMEAFHFGAHDEP